MYPAVLKDIVVRDVQRMDTGWEGKLDKDSDREEWRSWTHLYASHGKD